MPRDVCVNMPSTAAMSGFIENKPDFQGLNQSEELSKCCVEAPVRPVINRPDVHAKAVIESDPRPNRQRGRQNGYLNSQPTTVKAGYPMKLLIPEHAASPSGCPWIYPMTYGGGLVGGDNIHLDITVRKNCCALLTTQESTKIYHCEGDVVTRQTLQCHIEDEALLCVIPDPLVCYQDANYSQKQIVEMSCRGNLFLLEWFLSGRVARGECWQFKRLKSTLEVEVGGELVLRERLDLADTPFISLQQAMGQYQVIGTCLVLGEKMRELCEELYQKFGMPKPFGCQYENSYMCSASKVQFPVGDSTIEGIYLKIMAHSTTQAYQLIKTMITPLVTVVGGDPFLNKY